MFHNSSGSKTIILEMKFTSIFRDYNSGKKLYIGRIHSAKSYALEEVQQSNSTGCPVDSSRQTIEILLDVQ